jgi:hypothetical protein
VPVNEIRGDKDGVVTSGILPHGELGLHQIVAQCSLTHPEVVKER